MIGSPASSKTVTPWLKASNGRTLPLCWTNAAEAVLTKAGDVTVVTPGSPLHDALEILTLADEALRERTDLLLMLKL